MEIKMLKQWLMDNNRNLHKCNLIEYLQGQICKYSNQDMTPAEQIKGMNRLLRDIIRLRDEEFE